MFLLRLVTDLCALGSWQCVETARRVGAVDKGMTALAKDSQALAQGATLRKTDEKEVFMLHCY